MIDIDHFKQVNDVHGHSVGDEVIKHVANRLAKVLRDSDIICRYGGEEFAVLLPETDAEHASVAALRLLQAIRSEPVPTRAGPLAVTVSIGLAGPAPGDEDVQALLNQADQALYAAKRAGRDRVVAQLMEAAT